MTPEAAKELRKPFARESIGKLPKGGVMLDFVGHAVVTSRLLDIDPEWTWEPMGLDEHGLPAIDRSGNLWIRLTICGTTRIGVGDGKSAKESIGDAIRNAAMRFGVALDLWSKEELEGAPEGGDKPLSATPPRATAAAPNGLEQARAALLTASRRPKPDLDTEARTAFVLAALQARGLDGTKTADLQKLTEEWSA